MKELLTVIVGGVFLSSDDEIHKTIGATVLAGGLLRSIWST